MHPKLETAYQKGLKKIEWMRTTLDGFPHITENGKWLTNQNGHWTGGFWVGLLWLRGLDTGGEDLNVAKEWALKLKGRMSDNRTHDQGFIFGPSCVFGYRLTGEACFLPLIHAGARNLLDLYKPETGLVQAWAEPAYEGIAIVDTIMNLPLLWISGMIQEREDYRKMAVMIADRISQCHIREDFSTYHVAKWETDYHVAGDTHQGYSKASCWSRGQAWALYGFANMYRYTREKRYLDLAVNLAEYFYRHLNQNGLPAWDFCFQDEPDQPVDAAAASIAASGMLLTAFLLKESGAHAAASRWQSRGQQILNAEIGQCLYSRLDHYGIIEKVTVDYPRGSGVGESAMYGDYYFMEAVYRALNGDSSEKIMWLY